MIVLRVLNDCTITTPNSTITPSSRILFSLGCYLIAERGKLIPRHHLMSLLWPNASQRSARHSLRRSLWELRKAGFPLINESELKVFLAKDAAQLDADLLLKEPDESLTNRSFEILPWFSLQGSPTFLDWVDDFRYVTKTRLVMHLLGATSRAKARADWQSVLTLSEQALTVDPECTTAQTNAIRARQFLRSRYLPHPRTKIPMTLAVHESLFALPATLGEAAPPSYLISTVELPDGFRDNQREALTTLLSMLDHMLRQHGTTLHLWGDEDVGNSLLLQEFITIAEAKGVLTLSSTFQPEQTHVPLSALQSLITTLLDSPGAAGCHPDFTSLLTDFSIHPSPSDQTTIRLLPALTDLIEAIADEQPLILVFEHVHHANTASIMLLNQLASKITSHRVLLIGTSFSPNEILHDWAHSHHLRTNEAHWLPLANDAYDRVADKNLSLNQRLESGTLLCSLAKTMGDTSRIQYAQFVLSPLCVTAMSSLNPALALSPPNTLPALSANSTPHSNGEPPITSDECISTLQFQAISHAIIGSTTISTNAVQRLLTLARQSQSGEQLLQTLSFCANCHHYCGGHEIPYTLYMETFSRASREQFFQHTMHSAQGLARLLLDHGDIRAAHTWSQRMQAFIPASLSPWERHTLLLTQIQIALAHRNTARTESLFEPSMDILNAPLLGVRTSAKACYLRLLLLQGTSESALKQKAEELFSLCSPLQTLRGYHYEFFSLYLAHERLGDQKRGMQILQDYLETAQLQTALPSQEIRLAVQGCNAR